MLSKDVLELAMAESETMVVEWADTRDGYGYDVIEKNISEFFINQGFDETKDHDKREQIKTNDIPYIPGSSIKGAVRTAILWKHLRENTNSYCSRTTST